MDETERLDSVAAGTVAIAGIMALCTELARKVLLEHGQVKAIGDFMLDAVARSGASRGLQAHLHEAICAHLVPLLAEIRPEDKSSPAPEG